MNRPKITAALLQAFVCLTVAAVTGIASAAPVTDALDRPALMVREPSRVVLLSAAWAGERIVAVGERGIAIVSDDRGQTWRQVPTPTSVTLTTVRFADARHGVAVGHGGIVLSTSDAGDRWARRLDGKQAAQIALDAARAAGDTTLLKNAELLVADGPDKPFLDVLMFDAQKILVVGAYGLAFYSDNGGERWTPWMARLDNPKSLHLYAMRQRGDTVVIAGEQGLLLRSADGAKSFQRLETPYKGSYFTVELPSDTEILAAGLRGNVWRSKDAGATWSQVASPIPASIAASALAADGSLLLANQAGFVLRVEGAALAPINQTALPSPASLLTDRDGRVLAFGMAGVMPLQTGPVAQQGIAK
ncbi:MAG TPA: YCF48-related protein [Burkholderiaceae bacterium]|nr:YCF48-related protein [Burkholderiaceae bacterium]